MTKTFLIISLLSIALAGQSQMQIEKVPGGVKGVAQWYIADTVAGACILKSNILANNSLSSTTAPGVAWINHHPAMNFDGTNYFSIDLGYNDINQTTFFTVYQSSDTSKENIIWHIKKNGEPRLLLTTNRMADFDNYKYMNFTDLSPLTPKINIYEQLKPWDTLPVINQQWNIGKLPDTPKLPVKDLKGSISELISYNRSLDRLERVKVASYLALKYGITLSEPSGIYLNSIGETIWQGEEYTVYHHNIAGIGRDDGSSLIQKIASSSNSPDLLTVSFLQEPKNNDFLIWGDNDLSLNPEHKLAGTPTLLNRKWLLTTHGESTSFETEIILDTKAIYVPVHAKPIYWMAIDSSGTGDFTLPGIQYIKVDHLDTKGFAHFKATWISNRSGKNIFSFIAAQDLLLATHIDEPTCFTPGKGQLQVKILGGHPPYILTVINKTMPSINLQVNEADPTKTVNGLPAGSFVLKVTDALQQIYLDSFYVNNSDAPHPINISDVYELIPGTSLLLDASEQMESGVTYRWTGPNNFLSLDPKIRINENGIYLLTCSKNGCSYTKEVRVTTISSNIFNAELLYPNPSDGVFNLKVTLDKPAAVSLTVFTSEGIPIMYNEASGSDHYIFSNILTTSGVYYLNLNSGKSIVTKKLFIIK